MKEEKLAKKSEKKGQQEGRRSRRSRRTCVGIVERISVRKGWLVTNDTERLREVQAVGQLGSH